VRKILIPLVAVFIVAGCAIIAGQRGAHCPDLFAGDPEGIGTEDDDNARSNYELMMLRDPATGKIPDNIRQRELAFAATLPSDRYLAGGRTTAGEGWVSRGPWNVGGRTRAFAIDITNETTLIAGTTSGSMYRSTDAGATWHTTTPSNMYKGATCLSQDKRPGHTNVWYYGTGESYGGSAEGYGAEYFGQGVYKSVDGGVTWDTLHSTRSYHTSSHDIWGDYIWNIVTDPSDMAHDVVYAAAVGGIYRSADGGTTWTAVVAGYVVSSPFTANFADVAVTSTGVVYATISSDAGAGAIFRSTDGTTFTDITPASFPHSFNRLKIGISPSDESQVYILGNTPSYGKAYINYVGQAEWNSLWKYKYLSGDGSGVGGLWSNRSQNLPSTGTVFDKFTCQGSYDLVVKVKPNDTNIVFIGGTNLYRSTTGFADSVNTTYLGGYQYHATLPVVNLYLNHHPDQHELVFLPSNPNRMYSSNDGGVFYTNDNTVQNTIWTSLNNGYVTSMFYTCAIDHATKSDIIIGGAQDNGSWFTNSTNPVSPWVTPRGGDGSFCAIADSSKAYYFSTQLGKVGKLKLNAAGHVDSGARIDPAGGKGYLFINPFVLDPNNNNIMYLGGGKFLWRNNNLAGIPYANNYDSISTNWYRFPDSNLTSAPYYISALAACKTPANRVYIGTSNRKIYRLDSADVATRVYHNITPGTFPTSGGTYYPFIVNIAVDPTNGNNAMVVFSNYGLISLFYTSDGGLTWSKCAGNLEVFKATGAGDGPSCRYASIIPVSGGTVYLVGTSVGLFATTKLNDTGTVWVQQGATTIGSSVIEMIDYRASDGLVVVATHSGGMYSTHITSTGDVTGIGDVAPPVKQFSFNTYPNPFRTDATLEFNLPESGHVVMQVYDQMGRLVRTVADEQMEAGEHRYTLPAGSLATGLYYCTVKAGAYKETRTMVLVR
jgi:photosystem II stability/assembly factor-like uncharacterized protein